MAALRPKARIDDSRERAERRRSTRIASVGPPAANCGDSHDLESPVAIFVPSAVASTTIPEVQEKPDADPDPGQDGMETYMSVLTFMKIVSPGTDTTFSRSFCRHFLKTVELAVSCARECDRQCMPASVYLAKHCIPGVIHLMKQVSN